MEQYQDVFCWKCLACGRVLTTRGGAQRHRKKCKYVPPVLDGQINFDDFETLAKLAGENDK